MRLSVAWAAAAVLAAVDLVWIAVAGKIDHDSLIQPAAVVALGASAIFFRRRRVSASFMGIAQSLVFIPLLTIFVRLCGTMQMPLADNVLAAADRAIGFDWRWWYALSASTWEMRAAQGIIYYFVWIGQAAILPLILPIVSPKRNAEFLFVICIASCLGAIAFGLLPAEGALFYFGVKPDPYLHATLISGHAAFMELRAHPGVLDITGLPGIVAFPSFHALGAVIFAYAARGCGHVSRVSNVLNAMIILTLPAVGGHYLVDVLAGAAIALVSIAITRTVAATTERLPRTDTLLADLISPWTRPRLFNLDENAISRRRRKEASDRS